jgi:hypothetical protein
MLKSKHVNECLDKCKKVMSPNYRNNALNISSTLNNCKTEIDNSLAMLEYVNLGMPKARLLSYTAIQ